MKKLSKKEREEIVTKGYLHDLLDDKLRDYVTKSYLDEVFDKRFTEFRKEFRKEINQDFKHHIEALTEHYLDQLQVMFEGLDNRYVLRTEWMSRKS